MRGVHVVDLPVGAAEAVSGTMPVGVSAGDEVSGVTLARSLFTRFSYTVSGPADGTKLSSGNTATHQTALGVLYGTIIKSVYESGRTGERIVTYYVEASSAIAQDYTILAAIGVPTYVNKADAGGVVRFSDPLALRDTIKEEPWELL